MTDFNELVGKEVEVSWNPDNPDGKWFKKFLVFYLEDAARPFFCVSKIEKGMMPSAWDSCREIAKGE